jgi:hypothetical protein
MGDHRHAARACAPVQAGLVTQGLDGACRASQGEFFSLHIHVLLFHQELLAQTQRVQQGNLANEACERVSAPKFRWHQQTLDHLAVLQVGIDDFIDVASSTKVYQVPSG